MQAKPGVIERLNTILTIELTAINQYFVQSEMVRNWGYNRLADRLRHSAMEEMKDTPGLIARILFCPIFLANAYAHFTQTDYMAQYAQSKGVPAAKLLVQIGGVALALGSVSVLLGLWGDLGALALLAREGRASR